MFHAIYPKKTWENSCVPELFLWIIVFYTHSHAIDVIVVTSLCIELFLSRPTSDQ